MKTQQQIMRPKDIVVLLKPELSGLNKVKKRFTYPAAAEPT